MTLFHTLLIADDGASEADVSAVASAVKGREHLVRAALDLVLVAQGEPPGAAPTERPVHRYFSDVMRVGRPPLGVLPRIAARVLSA